MIATKEGFVSSKLILMNFPSCTYFTYYVLRYCLAGYGTRTVSTTRLQHSNHDALSGASDPKKPSYLVLFVHTCKVTPIKWKG